MKAHLAAWFALAGALAMGAFSGCGAESDPIDDSTDTASDSSPLASATFVTTRRDTRRCLGPRCGGYFIKQVNVVTRERYVSGLELADEASSDAEAILADVKAASDGETVLLGHLGEPHPRFGTRVFVVTAAWRGMPGRDPSPGDTFYRVDFAPGPALCLWEPCAAISVHALNEAAGARVAHVAIDHAAMPHVQKAWLEDRVLHHGALIAGHFDRAHTVLDANQVFVRLPAEREGCAARPPTCFPGTAPSYTRDPDRCLDFDRCIDPHACRVAPRPLFECPLGYSYVHWTADNEACAAAACDPTFAVR